MLDIIVDVNCSVSDFTLRAVYIEVMCVCINKKEEHTEERQFKVLVLKTFFSFCFCFCFET